MKEIKVAYYENGNVMYEIPYKNGIIHGMVKEYDKDENVIKKALYENGKIMYEKYLGN